MNLYKGINPQPAGTERQPVVVHVDKVDLGFRTDLMPRQLPPGSTPNMQDIRHERGGFRKDFGERRLGNAAVNQILCIIEHKFIMSIQESGVYDYGSYDEIGTEIQQFHRLIRLYQDVDNVARTDIWDSVNHQWVLDARAIPPFNTIEDRYVRGVSMQNVLLFAVKGAPILVRSEEPIASDQTGDNFPSETELVNEEDSANVTFTGDQVYQNLFRVNYDITLAINTGEGVVTATVEVLIGDTVMGSKSYTLSSPDALKTWQEEFIEFTWGMVTGTDVTIRLSSIESIGDQDDTVNLTDDHEEEFDGVVDTVVAEDPFSTVAIDDKYNLSWIAASDAGANRTVTWRVHVFKDSTGLWENPIADFTTFVSGLGTTSLEHTVEIPGLEIGDMIAFSEVEPDLGITWVGTVVEWITGEADHSVTVRPYNDNDAGIPRPGLTYREVTGTSVTLEATDGPEACWIEPFANRIVALCDGPDTQSLWWSENGDPLEWDPEVEGVDQIALEDTRNDPIDDLQCAAPLTSNALAIFRSRSIMRAVRTGRIEQAIAVNHWLENIGTESPFSRQVTPAGILFLGFDRMVYLLTEGGPQPVGQHIHQELVEKLTDNLHLVDSVFDPVFRHYYLGIPVNGSDVICETYIFELDKFIDNQELVWRVRSGKIQRFALASEL